MRTRTTFLLAPLFALLPLAACSDEPLAPDDSALANRGPAQGFHTLRPMESAVTSNLQAVWGVGEDDLFATGSGGTIQHFDGSAWTQQPLGTVSGVNAVWGSAANDVWAVGGLGAALHYDGSGWTLQRLRAGNNVRYQLFGVWGNASNDVWAVGNNGTSHHFDGTSWTYHSTPTGEVLRAVWGSASDELSPWEMTVPSSTSTATAGRLWRARPTSV